MSYKLKLDWHIDDEDPWLRVGDPNQSSSFNGDLDGKYLFFSKNQKLLMQIIESEILNHDFEVGKVIADVDYGQDYVACLYWHSPARKEELRKRWANHPQIKYRYYKTNADTRAGRYSKQYYEGISS